MKKYIEHKITKKKILFSTVLFSTMFIFYTGIISAGQVVDKIIAIVNGDIITLKDLNVAIRPYLQKISNSSYSFEEKDKILTKFNYIIGIGHIVPHRVSGFSGGAKIVQPGVCGNITTGQTHWLSALYEGEEIMGKIDNPIRHEINTVGLKTGLKFIINTVQDGRGIVYKCFSGDPVKAFEEGCKAAKEVFGVSISEQADIVISDSYPADVNLWQASKGIYSADLALKREGTLILVTPCHEGVSDEHPEIVDIGYQSYEEIKRKVDDGMIKDLTLAAHLVHVGRVIRDKGKGILVSPGVDKETTEKLGFYWAQNVQDALELAFSMQNSNASVIVSRNGGEIMPVVGK